MENIKNNRTKYITYTGMLIALSFIGSFLKVQGSIAFDSMPAFLGALIISPQSGAVIGVLGHMITAGISGFPFSLPLHIAIAAEMGVFTFIFGKLYKINRVLATVTLIFLNSVGGALIAGALTHLMGMGESGMSFISTVKGFFIALIGPLFLASLANAVLAVVVYEFIVRRKHA